MFEQRILCRKLPKSFDRIQAESNEQEDANKHNKIIQDMKRQALHLRLKQYEINIQKYENMYEQELVIFECQQSETSSNSVHDPMKDIPINVLKKYLTQKTNSLIRKTRYNERCFRTKLLRRRHSYSHSSLMPKETSDVYPLVIIDMPKICLSQRELDYLSRNGKFIISCEL